MEWFVKNTVRPWTTRRIPGSTSMAGPISRAPATVILGQIAPLRSDGETYASKLKDAGVTSSPLKHSLCKVRADDANFLHE
jgi:acetyl esterase/lipase